MSYFLLFTRKLLGKQHKELKNSHYFIFYFAKNKTREAHAVNAELIFNLQMSVSALSLKYIGSG